MPLLLSFCSNQALPLVNQLGANPVSKHSFSCNLTLSCKLLKLFNQNLWTKPGLGDLQLGILPSILFKFHVVISTFSCFLASTSLRQSCNHFASFFMICGLTPYVSSKLFLQPQVDHHHIFLLPDLIPCKTAFDYFQIVCFVSSYLPVPDTL